MPIHINHFGLQIILATKGERAFCNVKVIRYDLDVEGSSYQNRISIFFTELWEPHALEWPNQSL